MPPDVSLTPSFVGRDREMRLLRQAFEESAAGSGRVVLLSGEPGIGKTRAAQQLLSHCSQAGAMVLAGRCHDGDGAPAYWPWSQIFRTYVRAGDPSTLRARVRDAAPDLAVALPALHEWLPDLPSVAIHDSPEGRFRLFDGVASLLRIAARQQPLVVFLDDLHCADVGSLRLLDFVVRDGADARLLIIGTCRETELAPGPARESLDEIGRHGGTRRLHLGGLDDQAVGHLLGELSGRAPHPGEVTRIRRESGGNPFFVIELGRLLADEGCDPGGRMSIPPSVQGVIRRRLARLSAACNQVLGVAAVLGPDFDVSVLARACMPEAELVEPALDEATAAELLTWIGCPIGRLRFKHALVRETVYRALGHPERALLHGRIAAVLEHDLGKRSDPPLGEIAHHLLHAAAARDREHGIAYAERAARRALGRFAYEEAAAHYRCALAALDAGRPAQEALRCGLLLGLGRAHVCAGEAAESREVFRNAADLARSLRDPECLARAALGYAARCDPRVFNPDVVALLEEAVAATADRVSSLRAQLLARLAREVGGAALGRQAVELARQLGDPTVLTTVLIDARFARWGPDDLPERLDDANEILQAAEATRSRESALTARLFRVIDLLELGRIADVDHELAVLTAAAQELRQPWYLEHAIALQAMRARLAGRYEEAEHLARRALELGLRVQDPTAASTYAGHRLDLDRERGDLGQHETGVRQLAVEYPRLGLIRYVPPWLYAELGRHAEAQCELERLAAYDFADVPRDMNWLGSLALLAETAAALGDHRRAAALYELLCPYADRVVVVGFGALCGGSARLYLGRLATTLSRWEEAERHFQAALDTNHRLGALPCVVRSQHAYAVMLRARERPGDAEKARALWNAARSTAEVLGMTRLTEQLDAVRADVGAAGTDASSVDNLLRREGDYWTILFGGRFLRVRDTRGIRYLAQLVANPGRELLAADLVWASRCDGEQAPPLDTPAGDVLDTGAVAAYRRRLGDLREALREARSFNDQERTARVESEISWLARQLEGGLGLHGPRRTGSSVERARLNVRKGIAALLRKVTPQNPALGRHLAAAVRTGTFCSYDPDPGVAIRLRVVDGR